MNIEGKWSGVIIYGKEYRKNEGKELYFEIDILQDGENINGTAKDLSGFGVNPDLAKFSGTLIDNKINFVKQYASFHYYVNDRHNRDTTKKGSKIYYEGCFNDEAQSFNGSWTIKGVFKLLGFIPYKYKNTGTWSMTRVN